MKVLEAIGERVRLAWVPLVLLLTVSVHAGAPRIIELTCPACGGKVVGRTWERLPDARLWPSSSPKGAEPVASGDPATDGQDLVVTCPECQFSAESADFQRQYSARTLRAVRDELRRQVVLTKLDNAARFELAAKLCPALLLPAWMAGHRYAEATAFLRGMPVMEMRRKGLQLAAAQEFETAAAQAEEGSQDRVKYDYLAGEFCRRAGRFQTSLHLFDRAVASAGMKEEFRGLLSWIMKQRRLAACGDDREPAAATPVGPSPEAGPGRNRNPASRGGGTPPPTR